MAVITSASNVAHTLGDRTTGLAFTVRLPFVITDLGSTSHRRRIEAIARQLTGAALKVKFASVNGALACTDLESTIYVDPSPVEDGSEIEQIVAFEALLRHELGHFWFTPGSQSRVLLKQFGAQHANIKSALAANAIAWNCHPQLCNVRESILTRNRLVVAGAERGTGPNPDDVATATNTARAVLASAGAAARQTWNRRLGLERQLHLLRLRQFLWNAIEDGRMERQMRRERPADYAYIGLGDRLIPRIISTARNGKASVYLTRFAHDICLDAGAARRPVACGEVHIFALLDGEEFPLWTTSPADPHQQVIVGIHARALPAHCGLVGDVHPVVAACLDACNALVDEAVVGDGTDIPDKVRLIVQVLRRFGLSGEPIEPDMPDVHGTLEAFSTRTSVAAGADANGEGVYPGGVAPAVGPSIDNEGSSPLRHRGPGSAATGGDPSTGSPAHVSSQPHTNEASAACASATNADQAHHEDLPLPGAARRPAAQLAHRITRALRRAEHERACRTGTLDVTRLVAATTGRHSVFMRALGAGRPDVTAEILLDLSSSMGDSRSLLTEASFIISGALTTLGIRHRVRGFSGSAGAVSLVTFRTPANLRAGHIDRIADPAVGGGGTPLAAAVDAAVSELHAARTRQRLLIVLTDGMPDGGREGCRRVLETTRLAKRIGIDVVGVIVSGGRRPSEELTRMFEPRAATIDGVDELPRIVGEAIVSTCRHPAR